MSLSYIDGQGRRIYGKTGPLEPVSLFVHEEHKRQIGRLLQAERRSRSDGRRLSQATVVRSVIYAGSVFRWWQPYPQFEDSGSYLLFRPTPYVREVIDRAMGDRDISEKDAIRGLLMNGLVMFR